MNKTVKNIITKIIIPIVILTILILFTKNSSLFDSLGGFQMDVKVSFAVLLKIVMALTIIFLISNCILLILNYFSKKNGRAGTLATVLSSLTKYVSVLIAFCWILSILGVNVSTIFASVGIFALILGFGAESLVADLVTGIFILFENQYNVGDIIEVDGFRGTVTEIGIRTISIQDAGKNIKIINNSDLKNIVNRSNQHSVAVCDVGISYDIDLEELEPKLKKILEDIQKKNSDVLEFVEFIGVEALADSAVVLRIIAGVTENNVFSGRRLLNKEIKIAFDKAGITIAYPQLNVHTR